MLNLNLMRMIENDGAGGDLPGGAAALPDFGDDFTPTDGELDNAPPAEEVPPVVEPPKEDDLGEEETDEERMQREDEEARIERERRIRIPKARFDEAVNRERERAEAAERRAAELEAAMQERQAAAAAGQFQQARQTLAQLQDKYEELLVDGMRDEARQVRMQIEAAREQLQEARVAQMAEEARTRTLTTIKYETTLANIEGQYPELNPDNPETYSEAHANEVARLMQGFMATGTDNITALKDAVRYVMGAPAARPNRAAAPAARAPAADRAVAAREKAAAAAARQPQPTDLGGRTSAAPTPVPLSKMSPQQFAKLDEAALSKLRGDDL